MRNSHLSDDRLVEMSLTGGPSSAEQRHLGACPPCEARRSELTHLLTEIAQSSTEDAAAAFPAERLARQQARIMQRIEHDGRPGRVISFPASQPQDAPVTRVHPASRWIAAAAVAGLVVGLVAGRLGPQGPGRYRAETAVAEPGGAGALRAASAIMSDEELLGRIEVALDARGGSALRPLDDLTPRVWEVR